jgi:hypothetical protein
MTARHRRDLLRRNVISAVGTEKLIAGEQRIAVAT